VENLDKIVGRLFLFILFLSLSSLLLAQVKLRVLDNVGNNLQQAGAGEPFVVEVEVIDGNNSTQVPTIAGLDRFIAKRTGLYMRTINGKSTIKYSYQVRIDQPGSYEIGPAIITDHKKKQSSNAVTISVGEQSIMQEIDIQQKKQRRSEKKEFLRLLVDDGSIVVGQKVPCALRFYFNNNSIELKQIGKPEISAGEVKNIQGGVRGTESIDGILYNYIEWQWDFYPSQSGKITIPAYSIDFDVQPKQAHALGNFAVLFGPRAERKRIYSNAIQLQVDPLPPCDRVVQAIGTFKKIEAQAKPAVVKKGEAMVLTIDLEGEGNLEIIEIPELTDLPKQLKYYKSNTTLIEPTSNSMLPKKRFEFIVQGIGCGEWEIPSQLFTYFDIEDRSYKTLKTVPLAVTIVPPTGSSNALSSSQAKSKNNKQLASKSIYPVEQGGCWYPINQKEPFSWLLFLFLGAIPVGIEFLKLLQSLVANYLLRGRLSWWQKKMIFRNARKQLKQAFKKQDIAHVYNIFIVLIAKCCFAKDKQISSSFIKQQLGKKELPENIISVWDKFFMRATEYAFANNAEINFSSEIFFKQAEQWIDRFEELQW